MSKWDDEEEKEKLMEKREQNLNDLVVMIMIPYIIFRFITGTF